MSFKAVGSDGTESMKGYMNTEDNDNGGTSLQFYNPMTLDGQSVNFSVPSLKPSSLHVFLA